MRSELRAALTVAATLLGTGCARAVSVRPAPTPPATVVVAKEAKEKPRARELKIPPGHYPPRGQCRIWYEGRPPGRQPAPVPCNSLNRRAVGGRAFIVYGQGAWDAAFDWHGWERGHPGSVPKVVLTILATPSR